MLLKLKNVVRTRLRAIQGLADLINAIFGQTGLTLDPQPPYSPAFQLLKGATRRTTWRYLPVALSGRDLA
jgi:hypothetical protein